MVIEHSLAEHRHGKRKKKRQDRIGTRRKSGWRGMPESKAIMDLVSQHCKVYRGHL